MYSLNAYLYMCIVYYELHVLWFNESLPADTYSLAACIIYHVLQAFVSVTWLQNGELDGEKWKETDGKQINLM